MLAERLALKSWPRFQIRKGAEYRKQKRRYAIDVPLIHPPVESCVQRSRLKNGAAEWGWVCGRAVCVLGYEIALLQVLRMPNDDIDLQDWKNLRQIH